jgi:hypothetical protein
MAANITKIASPRLADTHTPIRRGPLYAGEVLPVACPCYVHTDGKVYKCVSTAVYTAPATTSKWDGFCIQGAAAIGDPVTLFGEGTRVTIAASGLTIGAFHYVSATAGALYDAAVAASDGTHPVSKVVSATDILIIRPPL